MTTHDTSTAPDTTTTFLPSPVPSRGRRAVLVGVGVVSCALPTVFGLNIARLLLTGELAEHRYHQITGQGEILVALWLVPIVLMLRAGWQGRRPAAVLGLQHLTLAGCGIGAAAVAPGGGAPFLVAVIAGTGALLWAALPKRPRLRLAVAIDPLLAPLALIGTALLVPYAVDQLALQNAATTGLHASNPHYFDQAWIALTLSVSALLAAALPASRRAMVGAGGALVVLGTAGLALDEGAALHLAFLATGVAMVVASTVVGRHLTRN